MASGETGSSQDAAKASAATARIPQKFQRGAASARDVGPDHARRMVGLLLDGLRYGTARPAAG